MDILHASRNDPELYMQAVLDAKPRRWHSETNEDIRKRLEAGQLHIEVLARTCHGAGKTWYAAALAHWWTATREGARTFTTAPTWKGVENLLWPEIRRHHSRSLFGKIGFGRALHTKLDFSRPGLDASETWYAVGASSDDPRNLEGHHSEVAACRIIDEGKAVPRNVVDATQGMLQSAESLDVWISTPSIPVGPFPERDIKGSPNGLIRKIVTIDDLIAEGVPGADVWNRNVILQWGGTDNDEYLSRAKAGYVSSLARGLIHYNWFTQAQEHEWELDSTRQPIVVAIGQDVAGSADGDQNARVFLATDGLRFELLSLEAARERNTRKTERELKAAAKERRVDATVIDAGGVGKGVYDGCLEDEAVNAIEWISGRSARDPSRFANLKTEVAWQLRDLFEHGLIKIPKRRGDAYDLIDLLGVQLCGYTYTIVGAGKKKVEDPEDSPDLGDALIEALYGCGGADVRQEERQRKGAEHVHVSWDHDPEDLPSA